MRVEEAVDITAPPEAVWAFVSDPARVLHFMSGVTRWEVVSDEPTGCGARYRMLMRVGSAEVGSLIEVVEFAEHSDLAWTSVTGIDQRARWRLRARSTDPEHPRTHVAFRLSYGVAGAGIPGWIAERLSAPQVRDHLRRSLTQLKRQVEHEQLRSAAADRRAQKRARASFSNP
ncbi:MAG: SRPBCC family protein [Actinomycetota bacterium]|nr:SRPBCC family protein [Actinomycetota bacterium]